jgi:hypothetical protein
MNKRLIAKLWFMVFGAFIFVQALAGTMESASYLAYMREESGQGISPVLILISNTGPLMLQLIAGLILWYKSDWLAGQVFADEPEPDKEPDLTIKWISTAFAVLGIYVTATALPLMVYIAAPYFISQGLSAHPVPYIRLVLEAAKLLMGISLFVYSNQFAQQLIVKRKPLEDDGEVDE